MGPPAAVPRTRIEAAEREAAWAARKLDGEADPRRAREYRKVRKRAREEAGRLSGGAPPGEGAMPEFLVIGAQKGGTAFFYHLLTRHPLVAPAQRKEIHYFDRYHELGDEWYRWRFPRAPGADGSGRGTISGEATPNYLYNPLVPRRAAGTVPGARLLALLRNPVERAYSHYQMMVRLGHESETFEDALEAEGARIAADAGDPDGFAARRHTYASRGLYAEQLERWLGLFPRERLLVQKSEDFFARPAEVLGRAQDFLGLPRLRPTPADLSVGRHEGGYAEPLAPATRARLEDHYRPHNERLYGLLGRDLGW